jgi:hypothetical protein
MRKTIVVLLLLLLPNIAAAGTFGGAETFESYANGDNIHTKNGGSGWAAAWANQNGNDWFATSTSPGQGSLSAGASTGNPGNISRQLTTAMTDSSTIVHVMMKESNTTGFGTFTVDTAANLDTNYILLEFMGGNIRIRAGADAQTLVTSYTANTWYHCYLDLDAPNHRARGYCSTTIPGASVTFSSYVTRAAGTTFAYVGPYRDNTGTGIFTVDDIRDVGTDLTATNVNYRNDWWSMFWW